MNLIKPKKLKKGDTIGIVALSGAIESKENIIRAKKYFEDKGYKVIFAENIFDKKRYLAGSDEKKVEELHKFFKNPEINAILCARGGYGNIRLLDKIDWNLIKNNPKIFAGYSDTTALELMMYKKTGLITFYAPMAQSDFGCGSRSESVSACALQTEQDELNDSDVRVFKRSNENSTGARCKNVSKLVEKSFFDALMKNKLEIEPCKRKTKTYFEGKCEGTLWGGNLLTITTLCGQDFIPDEKFILFIEEVKEDTYHIDRLMYQLLNIEKFKQNLAGIIMGDFIGIENKKHFDELFFEIGGKYKIPILSGFKFGHAKEKVTLPNGSMAKFSTEDKVLRIQNYLTE